MRQTHIALNHVAKIYKITRRTNNKSSLEGCKENTQSTARITNKSIVMKHATETCKRAPEAQKKSNREACEKLTQICQKRTKRAALRQTTNTYTKVARSTALQHATETRKNCARSTEKAASPEACKENIPEAAGSTIKKQLWKDATEKCKKGARSTAKKQP